MAISRWDPFNDLVSLRDQMDRLLGRGGRGEGWMPAIDVYDGRDELVVKAELPGIDPEDIELSVSEDRLTLRGERRSEERSEEEGTYQVERRYGRFERTISLPHNCDGSKASAICEDGVLEVRVPKTPVEQPRRVAIRRGSGRDRLHGERAGQGVSDLPVPQGDVDLGTSSRSEPPMVPEREVEEGLEPPTPTGEPGERSGGIRGSGEQVA